MPPAPRPRPRRDRRLPSGARMRDRRWVSRADYDARIMALD